jgi:mono/diheme cytochrome c family protein
LADKRESNAIKEEGEPGMRMIGRLIVVGLVLFAVLQIFRPGIPAKPATAEVQAPQEVKQVLVKNCYSCHSD